MLLLATVGFALAARPYLGIWHDGSLYFGQVLLHSRAPELARDLFFASGSQDRFSVYAHLIAPLYAVLGESHTHQAGVLASWAGMAAALLALLKHLDGKGATALWGLMAFAVMSPMYGGSWAFGYTEQFLTARSIAEPLLLWGLVSLLNGRFKTTAGLLAAATLLHPLMALPVLAITAAYFVQQDRRWLWLLSTMPLALLAGLAGIAPLDGLLKRYDPYWWSLFNTASPQVVLGNWSLLDWSGVALDLVILAWAVRLRPADGLSQFLRAVVGVTLALFAAAVVLVDGLQLVLVTQLQLWRAHWIAHLLAVAMTPWLVAQLWQRGGFWPASACALVLAMLNLHVGGTHALATAGLLLLTSLLAWRVPGISSSTTRLVCAGILLGALILSAARLSDLLQLQSWQQTSGGWGAAALTTLSFPTVALPLFGALAALAPRRGWRTGAAALGSLALLAVAVAAWDQRSDLARAVDDRPRAPHPFQAHVPPEAAVYWPEQLAAVWGLLERSSHFAPQQGSGMLFNRNNAVAFGARTEQYRSLMQHRASCLAAATLGRDRQALTACDRPSTQDLAALCQSWGAPEAVVLPGRLPPAMFTPLATWQPPAHRNPPQTFSLYACRQFVPRQP